MIRNPTTTVIHPNWLNTVEGDSVYRHLLSSQTSKRKLFGILEKPDIRTNFEEVSYKLFFLGKAGAGKTKTIADLAGIKAAHQDSNGIHKTNVYWPTKIWDKVILFRLQCWEAGDSGIKKFSHILPTCMDKTDALVFVFSFDDANSLCETSQDILKVKGNGPNQPATIVIGTRYSAHKNSAVSLNDIKEFESKWHLNVIKLPSVIDSQHHVSIISPVLNAICEQLWVRDQEYILKQSFDKFAFKE